MTTSLLEDLATDRCDECGRAMPTTGDSLCRTCESAEEARYHCTICNRSLIWLDRSECSDECEAEANRLLMDL